MKSTTFQVEGQDEIKGKGGGGVGGDPLNEDQNPDIRKKLSKLVIFKV